ncbi:MAG TPA: M28 family peptidase [Vicinamibacterales bacterium]|nr:M28 family peptidase [Vicinamibacterales bacterium]
MVVFACSASGTAAGSPEPAARFDSGRAFEHIRQLVAIGPRWPGSPGSAQARRYITAHLKAAGLEPKEQAFTAATPLGAIQMANVTALIRGDRPERIVIGGHYDTKLFREFRFVGANDGGSSTAMLLELARVLPKRKNAFSIELVFFDGEEALVEWWQGDDNTYGSRHYVDAARRAGTLKDIRAMILVDLVGDRDLNIRRDTHSTRWLTDIIWAAAARKGHQKHFLDESMPHEDDHIPFLRAGVPAVNIIDLDYPVWHTSQDTLEHVSARSLGIVADVLLEALPEIEGRLSKPSAGPR